MDKQECSLPLETSLTDLILKPNSDKIRRPPNAFMIFAREQRKNLSDSHPDVSNKVISSMLGKMWKNTPECVKTKYYQKSQVLRDLHKSQYPGYIYSPREARLQKMKRKMKKNSMNEMGLDSVIKKEKPQGATKQETDQGMTSLRDVMPPPQYVPNNPHINEYFIPEGHGMDAGDDDPDQEMFDRCSSNPAFEQQDKSDEMPMQPDQEGLQEDRSHDWPRTSERCGCCRKEQLACRNGRVFPYKREVPFHFPSHPQHPYAIPPSLYGSSERFPGIFNPFCCGPSSCNSPLPRSYESSIHPYWNPTMMNSGYLQSRNGVCGDTKPFSYPPGPYNFSRPTLGYFDRFGSSIMDTSDSGIYPSVNENWGYLRRYRHEFITNNPELRPCRRNTSVPNTSNLNACSSSDGRPKLQNWRVLTAYEQNKDTPCSFNNLEPIREEMPDSSSYSQHESSANRLQIQSELNNQEHSLNRNPEAMRMKTSYIYNFQNGNMSDKHNAIKNHDTLTGPHSSNVEQARSENTTISTNDKGIPQFSNKNDYKNAFTRMYNTREGPEKIFGNQSHVAPHGYTKSCIRNTESNSYLPNTQFQGTYYGTLQPKSENISSDTDSSQKMNENSAQVTEDGSTMPFTNIPVKKSNDAISAIKREDSVERETNIKNSIPQFHFYRPLNADATNSS